MLDFDGETPGEPPQNLAPMTRLIAYQPCSSTQTPKPTSTSDYSSALFVEASGDAASQQHEQYNITPFDQFDNLDDQFWEYEPRTENTDMTSNSDVPRSLNGDANSGVEHQQQGYISLREVELYNTVSELTTPTASQIANFADDKHFHYVDFDVSYPHPWTLSHQPIRDFSLSSLSKICNESDTSASSAASGRIHRTKHRSLLIQEWISKNGFYPNPQQMKELAVTAGMTSKSLRDAFSNFRARKLRSCRSFCSGAIARNLQDDFVAQDNGQGWFVESSVSPTASTSNLFEAEISPSDLYGSINTLCPLLQQTAVASCVTSLTDLSQMKSEKHLRSASSDFVDLSTARPSRKGQKLYARRFPPGDFEKLFTKTHTGLISTASENCHIGFPCTICTQSFPKKGNWQRHEKEAHGPHTIGWICPFHDISLVGSPCIFCSETINDISHFEYHNIHLCVASGHINTTSSDQASPKARMGHVCSDSSETNRTFARKDRLVQHIKNTHLMHADIQLQSGFKPPKEWSRVMEAVQIDPEVLWCGFCQQSFDCMADRFTHVGKHFCESRSMEGWIPRWAT